jgi:CRISPR-associated exonuclease Cas4
MVTGTKLNYYFICKRKLWLFSNGITMEHESGTVAEGRVISDTTYADRKHELDIDGVIRLDFADLKAGVIHEIKKSDAMEEAHVWQVKFYLYYLKQKGMPTLKGELNYPKLKRTLPIELTADDEAELKQISEAIVRLEKEPNPPERIEKRFCKKCAYYELCWV